MLISRRKVLDGTINSDRMFTMRSAGAARRPCRTIQGPLYKTVKTPTAEDCLGDERKTKNLGERFAIETVVLAVSTDRTKSPCVMNILTWILDGFVDGPVKMRQCNNPASSGLHIDSHTIRRTQTDLSFLDYYIILPNISHYAAT